jgi:hypothetical protein
MARSSVPAACSCIEAGLRTSFAMLRGQGAAALVGRQGARRWHLRA